jgi:RNA polymerase sporulation-specific sigma factor
MSVDEKYSLYNMKNIEKAKVDMNYLGELAENNVNLIWYSIHKYANISDKYLDACGSTKDDVIQLGMIGFMKAIKHFDTERGVKFSSFASITIAREVKHFLRSNYGIFRIPRSAQTLLLEIKDIETELGYTPSEKDFAEILDVSEKRIREVYRARSFVKSMDEPMSFSDTDDGNLCEISSELAGGNYATDLRAEDKIFIDKILEVVHDKLNGTDINVLKLQLAGNSQSETAKELGLSNMKVSRTVKKIRQVLDSTGFINNYLKGQAK